jgi:hypothetical protein
MSCHYMSPLLSKLNVERTYQAFFNILVFILLYELYAKIGQFTSINVTKLLDMNEKELI